jgi:hypothetical protein
MRRSASEIVRNLERRIARLEKQSASRMTPKHFLEMMERKHEDYFLGLDLTNRYTKQLLNFAKERMVKGSAKDKEEFILNIEALSAYLKQEAMSMDLVDAIGEIAFYMGNNPFRTEKLSQLEYTWKVGLTDRDTLLDEYKKGDEEKRKSQSPYHF